MSQNFKRIHQRRKCPDQKIESIIDNPAISLKKYITISKMYQQITKIGFIKKLEDGLYIVDISEKKVKNKNIFFK
jgi:Mg/Co/Ni transporter MgtE